MDKQTEEYVANQNLWLERIGGLKKGDHLLVIAKAETGQSGWGADWNPDMDTWVGRTVQYNACDDLGIHPLGSYGLRCHFYGTTRSLPFFILSKVER
jgi:hypothetical protein